MAVLNVKAEMTQSTTQRKVRKLSKSEKKTVIGSRITITELNLV